MVTVSKQSKAKSSGKVKPTPNNGVWTKALKHTWLQFSTRTSIHGVQYISDPKGNYFTRILWIIIPICCFVTANTLVSTFWLRFKSNPTRMTVETNYAPISELDFPAITFCSANRIGYSRALELVKSLVLPANVTQLDFLRYLKFTGGFTHKMEYNRTELELLQSILTKNRYDVMTTMYELMQPCDQLLYRCRWEGEETECMKIFKKSETYQGYCCSFNLIKADDTTTKSRRTPFFDIKNGLSVVLNPLIENKSISTVFSDGVKLLVHDSRVFPSDTSTEKMLPLRSETLARVKTEIAYCSKDVQALSVQDRDCCLDNEFPLQYFTFYHESNCDIECRITKTLDLCGCLPYYYATGTTNAEICNFTKVACLIDNYFLLHGVNVFENSSFTTQCPSQCNNKFYDVHTNSIPLVLFKFNVDPFYQNLNESHMIVHIFFGNQVYKKLRRDLLSNFVGLISSLGGVYSLFIGMSVLSFFEVIYFATIRLYQNYQYYRDPENIEKSHPMTDKNGELLESTTKLKWNEIIDVHI